MVEQIDRAVERRVAGSRSAVIEKWLRRVSRLNAEARLRDETIAYYESLSANEVADDVALSKAASGVARRLNLDEKASPCLPKHHVAILRKGEGGLTLPITDIGRTSLGQGSRLSAWPTF